MINRRGYEVVPEEAYYEDMIKVLKEKFPTMSESPANLLCIFARIMARNENARDYDRVVSYGDAYVATATGMALSKAVRTAGISRIVGTKAVGKVILTKDTSIAQSIIPAKLRLDSGALQYETTNTAAVIMNDDTLELEIISVEVGSQFNISNGSKFKSVLNILGLKTVVASTDIFGGTDEEADVPLRERYFRRMTSMTNSALGSIIEAVRNIPEVVLCSGNENATDKTVNGLLPHSFIIYASGGTDQSIADTIMKVKPAGIQTNGEVSVTTIVSGIEHVIKFSRYQDMEVFYDIEVAIDRASAPSDFVEALQNHVITFTNANNRIVAYELTNYLSQSMPSIRGIKTLNFGDAPNPTTNTDLVAPSGLTFVTTAANIKVTVM